MYQVTLTSRAATLSSGVVKVSEGTCWRMGAPVHQQRYTSTPERIPYTLSSHVMTARVCGTSRRHLAVGGTWSPSCSRGVAIALQLVRPQGDCRAPTWLASNCLEPLSRAVEAAPRRSAQRLMEHFPMRLLPAGLIRLTQKVPHRVASVSPIIVASVS